MNANRIAGPFEPSCGYVQSASGARVSWKSALPVKIYISSSWPKKFTDVVTRAANQWNDSTSRNLLQIVKGSISSEPARDHKNGVYWLTNWSATRTTEQAQTTLYYDGGVPYDGDIKVDAKYFTYYDEEHPTMGSYHLESLLVHEMGHLLGLAHTYTPQAVMYPYLNPYDRRVDVTATDLESIKCEYPK